MRMIAKKLQLKGRISWKTSKFISKFADIFIYLFQAMGKVCRNVGKTGLDLWVYKVRWR